MTPMCKNETNMQQDDDGRSNIWDVKAGRRMCLCCDGDDGATARVEKIAQTSVESHYV